MQRLLGLEMLRHEDDGATGKLLVQPRGHKRMTRPRDAPARQRAARLHTPQQGLRSGSSAKLGKEWVEHEADEPHQQEQAVTRATNASRLATEVGSQRSRTHKTDPAPLEGQENGGIKSSQYCTNRQDS